MSCWKAAIACIDEACNIFYIASALSWLYLKMHFFSQFWTSDHTTPGFSHQKVPFGKPSPEWINQKTAELHVFRYHFKWQL